LRPGLRSFPVLQYVIVYRIEDDDVVILHVFHGSRDIESLLHTKRGGRAAPGFSGGPPGARQDGRRSPTRQRSDREFGYRPAERKG
jgi:hypothetical protein